MGTDYYQADGADEAVTNNIDQTAQGAQPATGAPQASPSDDQNSAGNVADAASAQGQTNTSGHLADDQAAPEAPSVEATHDEQSEGNFWPKPAQPTAEVPAVEPQSPQVADEPAEAKPWEAPLDEPAETEPPHESTEKPMEETPPPIQSINSNSFSSSYSSPSFDPSTPLASFDEPKPDEPAEQAPTVQEDPIGGQPQPPSPEEPAGDEKPGQDPAMDSFDKQLIEEISKGVEAVSQESISEKIFMARANGTISAKIDNQENLNDEQMRKAYELWDWHKAGEILNKIGRDTSAL